MVTAQIVTNRMDGNPITTTYRSGEVVRVTLKREKKLITVETGTLSEMSAESYELGCTNIFVCNASGKTIDAYRFIGWKPDEGPHDRVVSEKA